jgi:hypothetical protein
VRGDLVEPVGRRAGGARRAARPGEQVVRAGAARGLPGGIVGEAGREVVWCRTR